MEENNNKSLVEKGIEKGKEYAKNKVKNEINQKFVKVILPKLIPVIGMILLILLGMGLLLAAQALVQNMLKSILGIFNPTAEAPVSGVYSSDFLEAAQQVHDEEMSWKYYTDNNLSWEEQLALLHGSVSQILDNKNKVTCCATYVACSLYACGHFTEAEIGWNYHEPYTISELLRNGGWEKVIETNDADTLMNALKPGDIVFFDSEVSSTNTHVDHVQIYAGDGEWYNAGGTIYIQSDAPRAPFGDNWKSEWNNKYQTMWVYRATSEPKNPPAERTLDDYNGRIITIEENGAYKLNVKDLSDKILKEFENQQVNNELMGFDINELEDMIEKYIEAEVKTTFPKTEHPKSDIDGMVIIKRTLFSGNEGDTGQIIDLKYENYKDFCEMVKSGNTESLKYFSLNPNTLDLCIAVKGNGTTYIDFDGNQTDIGGGLRVNEISYQKYIQNHITPVNFYIALHLISQDTDFMKEFLDSALTAEGIELTYVDTSHMTEKQYDYQGNITYYFPETFTEEEKEKLPEEIQDGKKEINNDNITQYYEETAEYHKEINTRYTGKLRVTNANTYMISASKNISPTASVNTAGSGIEGPNVVKQGPLAPEKFTIKHDKEQKEITLERDLIISETITTNIENTKHTSSTKAKQVNVEKFIELIKKYPKVKNNFETAPSTIFYYLEQDEKTQIHEKIMRYVLYKLTEIYYGVEADELNYLSDAFLSVSEGYKESTETNLWYSLLEAGYSEYAVAGIMGNLYVESNLEANNLENEYEKYGPNSIGYTDETYTEAINAGLNPPEDDSVEVYSKQQFISDNAGYGIALWKTQARKTALYDMAVSNEVDIDNENMQIQYLIEDLKAYQDDSWINAESVEDATKAFYLTFINPTEKDIENRQAKAMEYYEKYNGKTRDSFAEEYFPEGTKLIFNGKYYFPIYDQYSYKYSNVMYGGYADKTLTTSGCGTFAMASIVGGLLGNGAVEPISYVNNLDDYGVSYYSYGSGSSAGVYDNNFLEKYYGVKSKSWWGTPADLNDVAEEMNGQCAAIGYVPGHYVAILPALDREKSGYEFYVVDSAFGLSGGYTSLSDFRDSTGYSLAISAIIYY